MKKIIISIAILHLLPMLIYPWLMLFQVADVTSRQLSSILVLAAIGAITLTFPTLLEDNVK